MNILVPVFGGHNALIPFGYISRVELLGHRVLQPIKPVAGRVSAHLHIPAPGSSPHWSHPNSSVKPSAFGSQPSILKETL